MPPERRVYPKKSGGSYHARLLERVGRDPERCAGRYDDARRTVTSAASGEEQEQEPCAPNRGQILPGYPSQSIASYRERADTCSMLHQCGQRRLEASRFIGHLINRLLGETQRVLQEHSGRK